MSAPSATALRERIAEDTKTAMKARDKALVAALRMVNSEIKRIEVDERKELSDTDVIAVLNRMIKQRTESETQFRSAGRLDLADTEAYELKVIRAYMPEAISDTELDDLIRQAIKTAGATSTRDMGKVMNELRPRVQGRVDMGAASARVKAILAGS